MSFSSVPSLRGAVRVRIRNRYVGVIAVVVLWAFVSLAHKAAASSNVSAPAGATVVREVQAGGAQVYECRSSTGGAYGWALVGPKAVLIGDDGTSFGTHSAGPTWTAADGSSITADGTHPLEKADRPQGVPALLLKVTSTRGTGILSDVRLVRRWDTEGGLPPTDGCDAQHLHATAASHYSAVYTFYR